MSKYLKYIASSVFGGKENFIHEEAEKLDDDSDAQNAVGAPVEKVNPLGYNLDYVTSFYTIIQGIIGTGIFLTPGSVIKSINSIGATYVLWVAGFIIAMFEILVYVEYSMYFKKRSGGDVVYLEQAYPKPQYLIPTTYAAVSVILSYTTSSAIATGTYILQAAETEATPWKIRGVGAAALTLVCIVSFLNSKFALRIANVLGFVKVMFMFFMVITGIVVLGGGTRISDPTSVFKNAWHGSTSDGNAISNAILKVSFSYGGTQYAFALVGESNPKKTKNMFRFFLPAVVFFVFILYLLIITSYYSGIGNLEEIKDSGSLIASLFFQKVFGTKSASKTFDSLVALSALGHMFTAVVGHSRTLRECGRQGVLPYSKYWTSTHPFGTPFLPIIATFLINFIILVAPPAGDAYNFIVDISTYSYYIFKLLLVVGLIFVRRQRKLDGLGYQGMKVPLPILIITIIYELFVIAMAWVPPDNDNLIGSDVSFFYCTYALTCIGLLSICVLYYYLWAKVLPRLLGYSHRYLSYTLENGERGHTIVKVKNEDLAKWDAEHDPFGIELKSSNSFISIKHSVSS